MLLSNSYPIPSSNTNQHNLIQEHLIRQQPLAKQDQLIAKLLERERKKMGHEQIKYQLLGCFFDILRKINSIKKSNQRLKP